MSEATEKLVDAIMKHKNVKANKELEEILKAKVAKKIAATLKAE